MRRDCTWEDVNAVMMASLFVGALGIAIVYWPA
jgi:hypothetical protein